MFELQWAQTSQTSMQPLAIIEPFDEHKDLPARLFPGVIRVVMDQFLLQGAKEAPGPTVVSRF